MPRDELRVRFANRSVGRVRVDDAGHFGFTYDDEWRRSADAFPISLSLPISAEEYAGGAGHYFFANLLPEGLVRQAVCSRLGISEGNDFALLRIIGGDCAGALSIVEMDAAPDDPQLWGYELLDARRLQRLVTDDDATSLLVGGRSSRLSLAGAQDKLPVTLLDGQLHLPLAGAPSTHILKLPNRRYAHLTANEAFTMGLAARLGLNVVNAELSTLTDPPGLLVQRYDRRVSRDMPTQRLHQEDLCQALGLPSSQKYEQEGGPTIPTVIEVVREHVEQPLVDVRSLLRWQVFNVVAGNSDGHGKNLSILHDDGIRLAPFYDLVSTREYARLDRALAMGVNRHRDPDKLTRAHWEGLAAQIGVAARVVIDLVIEVSEQSAAVVGQWAREFADRHGPQPILQTLPKQIVRRARRVKAAVSSIRPAR